MLTQLGNSGIGEYREKETWRNGILKRKGRGENVGRFFVFLSFPMLFYLWEKLQTCYFEFVLSEHDLTKTRVFIGVAKEGTRLNWLIFGKKGAIIESIFLFWHRYCCISRYGQRAQRGGSKSSRLRVPAFGGLSAPNKRPIYVPLRIGSKDRCPA